MLWYERLIAAHTAVTDKVSHAEHWQSDRYFVWMEDGSNDLKAGNEHAEKVVTGVTDLYTKQEFDPWADALGESFSRYGIAWNLVAVDYEEETNFYHYSWDWEVS